MSPIRLYTYPTPNGHKVSIMLEETGLPYLVEFVDIEAGDQHRAEFSALNRNNKIPVIIDPDAGLTVVESGAILFHLADRSGRLRPTDEDRLATLQWALFQAAHVGPTLGQLWNFKVFAAERLPSVIDRFEREAARVFRVLDGELGERPFLAGRYGIADVMTWPWIRVALDELGLSLDGCPNLARWYGEIAERPAVRRGLAVPARPAHGA